LIDFKKFQFLLQKNQDNEKKDLPKHLLINMFPIVTTDEKKIEDFQKLITAVDSLIDIQIEQKIPILTISLGSKEDILEPLKLTEYCEKLLNKAIKEKINVTIIGRWYDLQGELVEALKKVNSETNEFDTFFFNLCINYDGQQEIADASRVIIRKIMNGKEDIDSITPDILKENIYSSYFIPPDLVIEPSNRFSGTFLYDSKNAKISFLGKPVLDITKADIEKNLDKFADM
jgi:undecaprenyl diphosphate synthase